MTRAGTDDGSASKSGSCCRTLRECQRHVFVPERTPAGEHLVQHGAEGPDVRTLVDDLPARLLGTHVRRGAENHPGVRHRGRVIVGDVDMFGDRAGRGFHRFRQPEVEHLHRAVTSHLDVRGLQIAMNDPLFVRGFQGVRDLLRDRQASSIGICALRDPLREIVTLNEFHHERTYNPRLFEAVDVRDVRMVQRCEGLGFARESSQPIGIGCERLREDFERDVAIQLGIARAIDLSHAAFADRRGDVVASETGAGREGQTATKYMSGRQRGRDNPG